MFLVKLYGFLDMLVGILLFIAAAGVGVQQSLLMAVFYLGMKGLLYRGDLFSMIDLGIAAYILISLILPSAVLSILAGAWLFLKGFQSLVS